MSSPDAANVIAEETFLYIARQSRVSGVNYNNLFLSGEPIDDTFDPNAKVSPILVAGYWPGGIDPAGHQYVMHGVNNYDESNIHDDRIFMRKLLQGAALSPAAVERHRQRMSQEERRVEQTGQLGALAVKSLCIARHTPFSYMMVSNVVQSDKITPGKKVATLYYPMGLAPKIALDALREQVELTIDEEII